MEHGPCVDDFPIKTSIYEGFSMATLNNQMVIPNIPDIRIELATASSHGNVSTTSTIILHSQESSVKPRKRKRKGSEAEEKPGGVHGSMPI
jgi:hypothetical protein